MEDFNLTKAKEAVDVIHTSLRENFRGFRVNEIWKGGSLGHGTVVPGHYDIDLVLFSDAISAEAVCSTGSFYNWTTQLKQFIENEFGFECKIPYRAVQFDFQHQGINLKVDLLVSPYWSNPQEFYRHLAPLPVKSRDLLDVGASKWQIKFFEIKVPSQAKEYIRRAKAWRNRNFGDNDSGRPSSYLMSLLVFRAFEKATSHNDRARPDEVTRELKMLVKAPLLDVYWEEYYSVVNYGGRYQFPPPPRVVDPANGYNNVWRSGIKGEDFSVLIGKIDSIDLSQLYF